MHHRIGTSSRECHFDHISFLQISFEKARAPVQCGAMAFAEVIENRDLVPFIEQQLGTNAADVTSAADNKDFHASRKCDATLPKSKRTLRARGCCNGLGF